MVRWFGGIKLGPGGLIRAYGGTAAECLRLADKQLLVQKDELSCRCSFSDIALIQSRLPAFEAEVVQEAFDEHGVLWRLALPTQQVAMFRAAFTDLTRGKGQLLDD